MNKKPKILLISSANPTIGPGHMGMDFFNAFQLYGYDIDFLTKYDVKGHENILYVYKTPPKNLFAKFRPILSRFYQVLKNWMGLITYPLAGYSFFYKKETEPPVPTEFILNKIQKKYDLVLISFVQGLLSVKTIEDIYDKLNAPIFFLAVDYSHMTGGCHFFFNCSNYITGCGCCPAWNSINYNDFTHFNILFREKIYNKINPVIFGNTYMKSFYDKSYLLKNRESTPLYPVVNESVFCVRDKYQLRKQFDINESKKFILFFGSQNLNDERKGMQYLIDALHLFYNSLTQTQCDSVLVISAGNKNPQLSKLIKFDVLEMGYVSFSVLPKLYSLADLFLSPSIIDAGPMMVNQALSCGTPVVAFEMGTALDVIKNRGTGYCAKNRDSEDFAKGIHQIFRLDKNSYNIMSNKCRQGALETTSYESCVKTIMNVYNKVSSIS
jgi:glycosyltransferase involved in cell wall biosynthesis